MSFGPQNKTVFAGNLPFAMTEETLRDLFEIHGEVLTVHLVRHRESEESRGFAYIKMPREAAALAIEALDGHQVDDRSIRVAEAQPRHERVYGSPFGGVTR